MGVGRGESSELGSAEGDGGGGGGLGDAVSYPSGGGCFLRPIDLLKISPNLAAFFLCFYFLYTLSFIALKNFLSRRTSNRNYNPMQIRNSAALLAIIMLYFK